MFLKKRSEPILETVQLLAVPYAAGSLNSYQQMKKLSGYELLSYEMPGRARRYAESGYTMQDVVEEIVKTIDFAKPYLLFGHSMGAFIAYETCAYIERLQLKLPEKLIVSGQIPPDSVQAQLYEKEMTYQATLSYLKSMGGTPDEVLQNEELIHYYAKILKDDFSLLKHYFQDGCSASIETDIAVWCGKDDAMISTSEVRKWHQATAGRCTITDFEGGHFFINQVFGDLHGLERQLHVCRNAYRGERDDLH